MSLSTPQEDYVTASSVTVDPAKIGTFLLIRHPSLRTDATAETQQVQDAVAAGLEAEKTAQEVTARQAKAALIEMQKDEIAVAAIEAIANPLERKRTRNWYAESNVWKYDNPILTNFAAALGINKDEFFNLAKTL